MPGFTKFVAAYFQKQSGAAASGTFSVVYKPPPSPSAGSVPSGPAAADSCECTTAEKAVSGSVAIDASQTGCKDHFNDGKKWCFVRGGPACKSAGLDAQIPGAAWKECSDGPAAAAPMQGVHVYTHAYVHDTCPCTS